VISAKLDAVAKSKQAYVIARTTMEQDLRERMRSELANLQTQIDIAVRYAIDGGESKADILRSLGTKDYGTINASLQRTQGVAQAVGADPFEGVYHVDEMGEKQMLYVNYVNHGPDKFNGGARFDMQTFDDGRMFFTAREPLWNEDYTVRNDAVAVLDGKTDGYYYEEVRDWLAVS
jgi:hypothetical protein